MANDNGKVPNKPAPNQEEAVRLHKQIAQGKNPPVTGPRTPA